MGSVWSDPEDTLAHHRAVARRRIGQLDRLVAAQEARILAANTASGDRSDAKLLITLHRGSDRLKEERVRAHAVLNKIEMALMGHYENEMAHDVAEMSAAIQENRADVEEIEETEIEQMRDAQVQSLITQMSLPEAPDAPLRDPPSQT